VAAAAASAAHDTRRSGGVCAGARAVRWRRGGQRWHGVRCLQTAASAVEEERTLGVTACDKTGAGSAGRRSVPSVRLTPRVI